MKRLRSLTSRVLPLALYGLLLSRPAAAAEGWEQPFLEVLDVLTSGLGVLGTVALGLGIMAYGLWACVTGRMPWERLIYMVLGGIFVMAGPTAAKTLLGG